MSEAHMWESTLASLFDCWQYFLINLDPDELYQRVLGAAVQATRSERASLMLLDEDEQLVTKAAVGIADDVVASARLQLGEGVAGWVAENERPLLLPDGPDVPPSVRESLRAEDIASAFSVPLIEENQVFGVLNLARTDVGASPFTMRDLQFTTLIAERIAVAVQTARLYTQLENQERFVTRILESIPSSLVVINRNLRIVSANRNFLEKSRRKPQNTIGRKIEEVFPEVLIQYTRLDQKVQQAFRTGEPVEGGKLSYRAPGLPTRIYYYRLIPLKLALGQARAEPDPRTDKTQEAVENVMLLMDDITEREHLQEEVRQAERHLASVVECANDLVVSMDAQGRVVTWNRAAERASGLAADQVKGRVLPSLCVSEQRGEMAEMLEGLARGGSVQNAEVNLLTANGHQQEVPIAWSCSPMRNDRGAVVGIVAVGRDLTERRQLEAQLIQSAKMASLGVMAGGIAHELRNPLGIASAAAQLLLEHPNDAQLRHECAEKIQSATERASLIIENLLRFARSRDERMREVDLHAVLTETLTLLTHQLALKKVNLRKEFHPDLPAVAGNPELLQQVFTNLVLNACNAMSEGGTLAVTTRTTEAGDAEISFQDTGHGIKSEYLSAIFDPFFTTMPVGEGTGLGLSISYSIVQQHHGTIEVDSEVGAGSTFTVQLPAAARSPVED